MPKNTLSVAFAHNNFRYFFFALFASQVAAQMQIVAVNWHVYQLTKNPISLGLIGLAGFIPLFFLSLVGGVFADKHNRKTIMIVSQLILALSMVALFFTQKSEFISPFIIYVIVAITAAVSAFDLPARQAIVPSLVSKEFLIQAVSTTTLARQISVVLGPAIAGFMIAWWGVGSIYLFNIFAFFLSVIALLPLNITNTNSESTVEFNISAILEGIKFVKQTPLIWSTMILDFIATFFASATVLLPIFAQEILRVGPQGLGFLYAAPSVGAIFAGLIFSFFHHVKTQGKILVGAVSIYALATIGFGLSSWYGLSLVFLAFVGAGDMVSAIIRNTIRQVLTPDNLRGRMVSINMIFFVGGPYLGEVEAGIAAAFLGGPFSVVVGGIATLLATGIITIAIPKLRAYQGHELKV